MTVLRNNTPDAANSFYEMGPSTNGGSNHLYSFEFTADSDTGGYLDSIKLGLTQIQSPPQTGNITVSLYTSGANPLNSLPEANSFLGTLGTISISALGPTNFNGTTLYGFTPNQIVLSQGQQYFVVLEADSNAYFEATTSQAGVVTGVSEVNNSLIFSNFIAFLDEAAACYCPGTLILTCNGERHVEALAIGDTVITVSGLHRRVRWIGKRSYVGRFLAANPKVQPIRFRAKSLGDGLPRRDLLVSPEHAMFLDGLLIPARCLVNGTTITQEHRLERVDYFHVELDTHDLLLAEGAPSETFLDDDSRGMFHNAAEFAALNPGAGPAGLYCASRVGDGYELEAIRLRLNALQTAA